MTEDQHTRARENEDRLRQERQQHELRVRKLARFARFTKPWVHPLLNQVVYEHVVEELEKKSIDTETACFAGLAAIILAYAFASWILHQVNVMLPICLHAYVVYSGQGIGIAAFAGGLWLFNQVRKFAKGREPQQTAWDVLQIPSNHPSLPGSKSNWDFFVSMALLLLVSHYVYNTEYGSKVQGVWICVIAMVLGRYVQGFGANSTSGILVMLFLFVVAFLSSPSVFTQLARV